MLLAICMATFVSADEFALLANHHDALQRRISIIQQAEGDISLACYRVDSSEIPMALLSLLRERAQSGVRVRVIVDGFISRIPQDVQRHLAVGGVQIRVFHPLFKGRPDWLNRRMHCKLLVVDKSAMIIGSRNLTDHHFGLQDTSFVDCDAYITGNTCHQAAEYFEWLWQSPDVSPIGDCPSANAEPKKATCKRCVSSAEGEPTETLARLPLRTGALCDDPLDSTSIFIDPTELCLLHDRDQKKSQLSLAKKIIALIDSAQHTLTIESPYPAFSNVFMDALERATRRGVTIVLLTNSLRSTDQVIVYAAYQNQKSALLRHGVRIFEFAGPEHLHAKGMVIDDRLAVLGSYNFDARSERLNLELCVLTTNCQAVSLIAQSMLRRQAHACRVLGPHAADVVGESGMARRAHMRSVQWFAPLLRPSL